MSSAIAESHQSECYCSFRLHLTQVQAVIGAKNAMAFDLTAACSGFVVGVITAAQFIRTGRYRNIVVIGADALSRYVDWRDRGELSLMCRMLPKGSRIAETTSAGAHCQA